MLCPLCWAWESNKSQREAAQLQGNGWKLEGRKKTPKNIHRKGFVYLFRIRLMAILGKYSKVNCIWVWITQPKFDLTSNFENITLNKGMEQMTASGLLQSRVNQILWLSWNFKRTWEAVLYSLFLLHRIYYTFTIHRIVASHWEILDRQYLTFFS